MTRKIYIFAIIAVSLACTANVFADVKIKSKQTMSGQSYENTTYIKGKRQRTEMMNGMMISLTQCDLRRGVQINPNTKTYLVNPFNTTVETVTKPASTTIDKNGVVQSGGTVSMTITTKDTGERKQMFGYTARHLIITMETVSSPDACTKSNTKMETDGWYIDFEQQFDCGDSAQYSGYRNPSKPSCQDKYVTKNLGTGKRGYPVYEKMTMFDESGKETMSYVNEVVELSKATLDPSLFDVPQDYRQVSDASQMYAAASTDAMDSNNSLGSTASTSRGSSIGLPNTSTTGPLTSNVLKGANTEAPAPTMNLNPKKAGVIRIGLANVKTGAVGEGIAAPDLAAAVQNSLRDYLKVPNLEVVILEAKLTSAVDAEAKEKECDLLLFANVSHKKGGGGFGMFKAVAPVLSSVVPMAGMAGVAGAVAGSVASSAIMTAANVSGNVKAKDELTLDVKLNKIDGSAALAKQVKVKAKSNGEDIISAAVEQAAQAIVDSIGK
jgi:hypothetical protein